VAQDLARRRARGRRWREGAALALLAGTGLVSSGLLVRFAAGLRLPPGGRDEVSQAEARFAPLRPLLPAHGVVGYLSDRPDAVPERYLAQYALAPLVLRPGPDGDAVVGNFFDPAEGPRLAAAASLAVVRDLGQGLLLLRPAAPAR
jgi:hypothetical protein